MSSEVEREHVLSSACWCNPEVETFGKKTYAPDPKPVKKTTKRPHGRTTNPKGGRKK